jgi:ABC-type sugar transport system ATPase subunit
MTERILTATDLTKRFGGTLALDRVSLDVMPGEVHALVGENGAGKSTLINILSGVVQPDGGEIALADRRVSIASPRQSQALGIATVFQEFSLTDNVSIGENIFAGRVPSRFGMMDRRTMAREARAVLEQLGIALDPTRLLKGATVSTRQMVEIAKAISLSARLLLLDEPTAALSPLEVRNLFDVVARLKARGIGIVYISHHLTEVLEIADRITVLRDGRTVATHPTATVSENRLIRDMVGREIDSWSRQRPPGAGNILLAARSLSGDGTFQNVDLSIASGEIVGLTGAMGSFRTELCRTLAGVIPASAGEIMLRGRPTKWRSLSHAISERVAYVPEDRKSEGLFLEMSTADNLAGASRSTLSVRGIHSRRKSAVAARRVVREFGIKTPSIDAAVGTLSGGNQQKVLIGRWLESEPEVVILEEPTRGVDIAAKRDIHELLSQMAARGAGLMIASSDLAELMALCDRILVLHEGRIVGDLKTAGATQESIIALASGLPTTTSAAA